MNHSHGTTAGNSTSTGVASGSNDEVTNPFQSKLWGIRLAIQRGYDALYAVQVIIYVWCCVV